MIARLELGAGATEQSEQEIVRGFDLIEDTLGGGAYLVGDRFTRADLTGAALLAPVTWPKSFDLEFPPPEMIPPRLQTFMNVARERRAFHWAEDMYARHRQVSGP